MAKNRTTKAKVKGVAESQSDARLPHSWNIYKLHLGRPQKRWSGASYCCESSRLYLSPSIWHGWRMLYRAMFAAIV